jgi:DNA-directed RNA polymerase subunit beta'
VMSRKARIFIVSPDGRELQHHDLEYGSTILVQDKQPVKAGTRLAEWDPTSKVLLTEKPGVVKFIDLIENVTVQERFDEKTKKSRYVVLEHKGEKHQPALAIEDESGNEEALYFLPAGSYLLVNEYQKVEIGDLLVKIPREASRIKDITGGLPRIAELFEARMPKDPAIIADIDGEIVFGGLHRGLRKISIVNGAQSIDYFVPRGKQVNVLNGEKVNAGDPITSGSPVLHDILRIMGPEMVQRYLVDQIQQIYRLQGIDINDRHIELIVKQMLRKVRVVESGDTDFLISDRVDRVHFKMVNSLIKAEGKRVAAAKPILMGITQASLGTESFISAASFQETTRILSEAAISSSVDHLYGLKENVIVGKLIPAGTGIESFRKLYLGDDVSDLERQAQIEEMNERKEYARYNKEDEGA